MRLAGIYLASLLLVALLGCDSSADVSYQEMDWQAEQQYQQQQEESHASASNTETRRHQLPTSNTQNQAISESDPNATGEGMAQAPPQKSDSPLQSADGNSDLTERSAVKPLPTELLAPEGTPSSLLPEDSPLAQAMKNGPASQINDQPSTANASAKTDQVMPLTPKLLIPHKTFIPEGTEQALRVTFDDIDLLKVLNMEPVPEDAVTMFPDWLRQLDGELVRIRGFMYPTLSQTGITYFQHVRDNEICCFGRTPKVYDRISTILKTGTSTNYIQGRPFDVIGILRFDPVYEDGEWLQLYLLEDAVVID